MKKLGFILSCLFIWYLAGMYRYPPLMILAQLELIFFLVSFFLSRYFRSRLAVEVLRQSDTAEKGTQFTCIIRAYNRGKLPVSNFRIRLWYGYGQELRPEMRHVYGGSESGENLLRLELSGKYCGMIHLKMSRLRVYDYLNLFSASKKLNEEMWIAVFPQEKGLQLELPSLCYQESNLPQELRVGNGEETRNEIRQLREYRTGDSNRYIHWNQSARMGQLWVKEYEKETDYKVLLFLDLDGIWEAKISGRDHFYELLSALLLGLLRKSAAVRVCWYDGERKCFVNEEATNKSQCRDILLMLYRMGWKAWDPKDRQQAENYPLKGTFKLDMKLCWYWNGTLIFQFDGEELDDQITYKQFVI
jgi:uncharacterized protein (DUF58 family)